MTEALIILQLRSEAFSRGMTIVAVSLFFILLMTVVAFYIVRMVNRGLREDKPEFGKDTVMRKRAELLAMAKKKQMDRKRTEEMAAKVTAGTGEDFQEPSTEQARKGAQEAARDKMQQSVADALGSSCPHCHIPMAADESLVVCPVCLTVQHQVCFDLSGCVNGCEVDYIYEYPSGAFRDLGGR
jgi:hypothetical protein